MSRVDERANRRFRILTDVDKRQDALEQHAVQLLLQQQFPDPNLPMITGAESARVRSHCESCKAPYWGLRYSRLCDSCQKRDDDEQTLYEEVAALEQEVRRQEAERRLAELRAEQEKRETLARIAARQAPDRVGGLR